VMTNTAYASRRKVALPCFARKLSSSRLAPIIAGSKPRAANNSKVSAFITLPPRWRVSFVATKLLLSPAAATQPARQRCSFLTAQPKYYLSLGETTSPTRCRTIFRVGWRRAKTSRSSTAPKSAKCPAEKSWNKSNWKIPRQASAKSCARRRSFPWSVLAHAQSGCRQRSSGTRKDSSKLVVTSQKHQPGVQTNGDQVRSKRVFREFLQPGTFDQDRSNAAQPPSAKAEWPWP